MLAPKLNEINAIAARLPAAPQVLAELYELLEDLNADLDEIAMLLRRDGPLAAAVLRVSNSAYYGGGGIGSVEEAVARIGFAEMHRLAGCAATSVLADRALSFYGIGAEKLREHMVATALACEGLANLCGFKSRHAYTAGLLRPIGMMVLDRLARGALTSSEAFDLARDGNYPDWESRVMHIPGVAVAAMVLAEWRFAPDVIEAVKGHRMLTGLNERSQGASLLNLSGWVVTELGLGLPGEKTLWDLAPAKLELACLTEEQVVGSLGELKENMDRLRPALR